MRKRETPTKAAASHAGKFDVAGFEVFWVEGAGWCAQIGNALLGPFATSQEAFGKAKAAIDGTEEVE